MGTIVFIMQNIFNIIIISIIFKRLLYIDFYRVHIFLRLYIYEETNCYVRSLCITTNKEATLLPLYNIFALYL